MATKLGFSFILIFVLCFSLIDLNPYSYSLTRAYAQPCTNPVPARRVGQKRCWVSFKLTHPKNNKLCLSQTAWVQWLHIPSPGPICSDPSLPWNSSSFLENNRSRHRSNSNSHVFQKKSGGIQTIERIIPSRLKIEEKNSWIYLPLQKLEAVRESASSLLRPHDPLGIMRCLLLNEKIPYFPIGMFRLLGFVHLTSATGIHLYSVATFLELFIKQCCLRLRLPVRLGIVTARILAFFVTFFLWLLSGARLGMLRPWILISVKELAVILGFRWRKAAPLFCALFFDLISSLAMTAWFPEAAEYSGRWVYTLAVGGGLFWHSHLSFGHWVGTHFANHLGLAIGSWLLVALWEGWETGIVALATPLLSLITLPALCSLGYPLMVSAVLISELGFPDIAGSIFGVLGAALSQLIIHLSEVVMFLPSLWIIPQWAILIGIVLGGILTIVPRGYYPLLVGIIVAFRIFQSLLGGFSGEGVSKEGRADKVEQLDIGQGDGAIITGPGTGFVGLVDTGSKRTLSDDAWMKIFSQRQINSISWIGLTHLDEDHAGGILNLARLIRIQCVAITTGELQTQRGKMLREALTPYGIKIMPWSSGCIPFPSLEPEPLESAPIKSAKDSRRQNANSNMGALWVPLKSNGFYLSAGDATTKYEITVASWMKNLDQAKSGQRILKISHHGSKSSSSLEFLKSIKPTEAWISVGIRNRYGHPAREVLDRLAALRIPVRRTDREGSLSSSCR